jgi:hypothetical protein
MRTEGGEKDGSQEKSSEEEKGSKEACKEEKKEIESLHTRTQKEAGEAIPQPPLESKSRKFLKCDDFHNRHVFPIREHRNGSGF